jgi:hypothetical protein
VLPDVRGPTTCPRTSQHPARLGDDSYRVVPVETKAFLHDLDYLLTRGVLLEQVDGQTYDCRRFEIMVVSEDDQQQTMAVSPASMIALVALSQADGVLLPWDPTTRVMILANIVGQWLPRPDGPADV